MFMKQESKLVTYVAGSAKSTVDYIMVRQGDKVKVSEVSQGHPKRRVRPKPYTASNGHAV